MKLSTHYLRISLITVSFVLAGAINQSAHADDAPVTLGISPAIAEVPINRGQSAQRELVVVNKENTPVAVRAHAENFEASDPYGAISFNTDSTEQYASSSWIKLKSPNLILGPHQQTVVSFTIDCPPDAEPGGHYSTIFLEPVAATAINDNSSIGVSQRVGALLFITVNGNNTEQGSVLGASTSGGCSTATCSFKTAPFREWGPVPFSFQFQNTGNVHVKVSGNIAFTDMFGHKLGEVAVNEKTVLPGSARAFEVTWLREVLFGKYDAVLTLAYGSQHRTETARISFWVIPWKALAVGALIIAILSIIIVITRHKRLTKQELS